MLASTSRIILHRVRVYGFPVLQSHLKPCVFPSSSSSSSLHLKTGATQQQNSLSSCQLLSSASFSNTCMEEGPSTAPEGAIVDNMEEAAESLPPGPTSVDLPMKSHDLSHDPLASHEAPVETSMVSHDPLSVTSHETSVEAPMVSHDPSSVPSTQDLSQKTDASLSYLSKGFTSEIFKIQLANLPSRIGYQNLRKYLTSLELSPAKIKKPSQNADIAFINFRNEEERVAALKLLDGKMWKNKALRAKVANPTPDPLSRNKRPRPEDTAAMEAKRAKIQSMSLEERLQDAVTPWFHLPYHQQLQRKQGDLVSVLKKMARRIGHKDSNPGEWFEQYVSQHKGMVCPLDPIRYVSSCEGYRNKCEFSIGRCSSLGEVVVGFRLGSYEEGDFEVVSASTCHHIPQRAKELVRLFESFFKQSHLKPYSSKTEEGYWRMLTLRCYLSGETMGIVQIHPQQLTQDEIEQEKSNLTEFFSTGEGSEAPPTSLYFQVQGRLESGVEPVYHHLLGEKYVHENLLGLKFRISPPSFFQVNSLAAELLYSVVRDLAVTDVPRPVIYDICCGTGTIGLYLAKSLSARKVVGVEMVKQAIEDAEENAKLNDISNVQYVCGKAEEVMSNIELPWVRLGGIVGIVDPPRGGLHNKVTCTIRQCSQIQRLVYVSCNPNGMVSNIVDLCRRKSNRVKGNPFRVVRVIPVDMFPHTPHCEVVVLLERVTEKDAKEILEGIMREREEGGAVGGDKGVEDAEKEGGVEMEVVGGGESDMKEERVQ